MKKILPLLIVLYGLLIAMPVSAHRFGSPIVKINGKWAPSNPIVNYISDTDLTVAADLGPSTYVAGQNLTFAMNDTFQKAADGTDMLFKWDFGDGTPLADNISATHAYGKPGTYVTTVSFRYPNDSTYYPSDNILVTILPDKNATLPRSEMSVDNKHIPNDQKKAAPFQYGTSVLFDASLSNGDNLKYHWDFGDGSHADIKQTTHAFTKKGYPTFVVVLRVTDRNNIASDAAVFLTEGKPVKKTAASHSIIQQIGDFFKQIFGRK